MNRKEAFELVESRVKNEKLIKHMLGVEACMDRLAIHFNGDRKKWALAGLLHDIDYEETKDCPEKHGLIGAEFLKEYGISDDILKAIRIHAGHGNAETDMEISLLSSDALSGLIVAGALVHPDGISGVTSDFVLRKFKQKRFAQGADRELIKKCEEIGLSLEDLITLCLNGMKEISDVLNL